MKIVKISLLSLLFIVVSCKKAFKEVTEELFGNATEKVLKKELKTEITEEGLSVIRKMDLADFRKVIDEHNINVGKSFQSLDENFQKAIKKSFEEDANFRKMFLKNQNLISNYKKFAKSNNLSKIANDGNFFKWYALASKKSENLSEPSLFQKIQLQENNGIIYFLEGNNTIAKYRGNGIIELSDITKSNGVLDNPLLKEQLLPNSTYKVRGKMGVSATWKIDDLGRVESIKGDFLSPEQMQEILHHNTKVKLDPDYSFQFQKLKQSANNGLVHFDFKYTYADDSPIPERLRIEGKTTRKTIINAAFPNKMTADVVYDWKTNAALLKKYKSKFKGLTEDRKTKLLQEMDYNPELAKSIHQNPQKNIERYLNSHNPVNKNLIDKLDVTSGKKMPENAQVYAGNTFYFDPLYNPKLAAILRDKGLVGLKGYGKRTADIELLKRIDETYPNGVKWSQKGYPDFASLKDKDGKNLAVVDLGKLSGNSETDIKQAENLFIKNGGIPETGYTWHHIEYSSKLVRVPSHIHDLMPHSGGMATHRKISKK